MTTLTTLDALLIFLVGHKSQSGYDVRQLFQATPLGIFSDSPGSIYPSLARLEARGMLTSTSPEGGRRRRSYKRTVAGQKALHTWLERPVEADSGRRNSGVIELRFVMMVQALGWPRGAKFLKDVEARYAAELSEIETYLAGPGKDLDDASKATVDLGVRTIKLRIDWCRETRKKGEKR